MGEPDYQWLLLFGDGIIPITRNGFIIMMKQVKELRNLNIKNYVIRENMELFNRR